MTPPVPRDGERHVCPKCTGVSGACYLTCPTLAWPPHLPPPSRDAVPVRLAPGSYEAAAQGCCCAVMDNNHGKHAPFPPDGWYITEGCPVHAPNPAENVA